MQASSTPNIARPVSVDTRTVTMAALEERNKALEAELAQVK